MRNRCPSTSKTTLRNALAGRFPALQEFDYGKLLLEREAAEGVEIDYSELREKSSSLISPFLEHFPQARFLGLMCPMPPQILTR